MAWSFSSSHLSLFSGFRFLYSSKWVKMNLFTWIYLFNDFYSGWLRYFIQLIFSWLLQDTSLIQTWFLAWSFSSSHFSLFSGFRFLYSSKWVRMNIYTWIYLFNDFHFCWFLFHSVNFLLVTAGHELNADIVLGLVILIITLLALFRFLTYNTSMLIPTMWILIFT